MANISAIKLPNGVTYDLVDRVSKDVFIAEYGVTTYDEIDDAFIDGKAIILKWQSAGYYRYFPCSVIDTSSSYKLTFLMGESIAYDVEVKPLTPPLDWSYSSRNLQETLVSGTSIKTINNNSLLGSGNIDTKDVFVAIYGESSFTEVENAIIGGKQIFLSKTAAGYSNYYPVSVVQSGGTQLDLFYISRTGFLPASTSVLYHASITSSDVWSFEEYPLQPKLVSGTNIKTINSESLLGSGNITVGGDPKNIWYATCSTAADTSAKVATTDSQDFVLKTGNMVRVKFDNGNISSATATLNVDGTGARSICTRAWDFVSQYYWRSDEIVDFVYDGTNFVMSNTSAATTVFYGVTKLSSSTSSTSEVLAATPKAVKVAYDLADGKQDELVSGTNIKTINGNSILGSGDLTVTGGTQVQIVRW